MKKENNVVAFSGRQELTDGLTELLRTGAVQLIQQAVEAELAGFMEQFSARLLEDGKAAVNSKTNSIPNADIPF